MTTQHLREELERIAAGAPTADVPDDTWSRGRRSLVRTRVLAGAAALAVVAVVVGVVSWPDAVQQDVPVAGTATAGLPDHLYAVPESVPLGNGLAVGQTAAAWVDPQRMAAVLVGAEDGAYHLVELPGLRDVPIFLDEPQLALSPDGLHVAWAFGDPARQETGVRVADLGTGEVTTSLIDRGEGVSVLQLAYSPDGRWLGWSGAQLTFWNESGSSRADGMAVGRIDTRTGDPEVLRSGNWPDPSAVGIDQDGRLLVLTSDRLTTLTERGISQTPVDAGRVAGPLAVDAAAGGLAAGVGGDGPINRPAPGTGAVVVQDGSIPADYLSSSTEAYSTALAWVGSDVLAWVSPLEGSHVAPDGSTMELLGPGHEPRVVGHADPLVPRQISVAADLVTADRPTVERAEPDWPWSGEHRAVVGGALVLGLLGLGWLAERVVRRRRPIP